MKHVIVIETVDRPERIPDAERFTQALTSMVEELAEVFEGPVVFVRSSFYQESAIAAVHEMYNAPPWEGGS